MQINKSDRNDAYGVARIMQAGWNKEVRVKNLDSHVVRFTVFIRVIATVRTRLRGCPVRKRLEQGAAAYRPASPAATRSLGRRLIAASGDPMRASSALSLVSVSPTSAGGRGVR